MNLIQLKSMVSNSHPVYRKPMCLKTNETEKRRRILIMKERTLDALQLWKMLENPFVFGTYFPIIDTLIAEVRRRKSVYCILQQDFNFLPNLNTWAISNIENAASKLLKVYANNLDSDFPSEVVHFAFHLRLSFDLGSKTNTAQAQLSYLKKNC